MRHADLCGVIVPVITPVDDEDRVDEAAFRQILRRLVSAGVHGIFVGGSAGEGPLLTLREWTRMIEIASDEVNRAIPLLGGAIDTSTQRVKEKIRILAGAGYCYLVVTPAYYINLRTPGEHLRLLGECAEAAPEQEIVAYNIPSCVHSEIPVKVLLEAARRGWIRHCKESSGNLPYFQRLVAEGREVGLRILEGEEPHIAEGLLAGAVGIVPVCANLEPATYIGAYQAALACDLETLARLQERALLIRQVVLKAVPLWIAGIKYALSVLGYGSGQPVSPLQSLTDQERQGIAAFVQDALARGLTTA
jgi:4-hydroxy-tetrahydrodipicolinate synthase